MRSLVAAVTMLGALGLAACAGHRTSEPAASVPRSAPMSPDHPPSTSPPRTTAPSDALPTKVLVVIEENHSLAEMRSGMPFLAAMSDRYGYATHWRALAHPSEPNYLAIVGGSTFGVTDDAAPAANAARVGSAHSVFFQALASGRTAATYAESMPTPCGLSDAYPYAVRHNPWTYFGTERQECAAHDVSTTSFADDARRDRLPAVGLLVPDVLHDAHDGSLAAADDWLRTTLAPVLSSADFTSGRLVVVVTADEDDRSAGNTVLTSVLTVRLQHRVVDAPLDSTSLTLFIDDVLGVPPLGGAAQAPDMGAAFGLLPPA